jgi:hypothetical protein
MCNLALLLHEYARLLYQHNEKTLQHSAGVKSDSGIIHHSQDSSLPSCIWMSALAATN